MPRNLVRIIRKSLFKLSGQEKHIEARPRSGEGISLRNQPSLWLSRRSMFSGHTHTHTHTYTQPFSVVQVSVSQTSNLEAHHEINLGIKIGTVLMTWNIKAEAWNTFFKKRSECVKYMKQEDCLSLFLACVTVCVCGGSPCKMCWSWLYLLSGNLKLAMEKRFLQK